MTGCKHDDDSERETDPGIEPDTEGLMRAVFRRLGAQDSAEPHVGGKFLALACRGQLVREHFDAHHPDQIEVGERMALPEEADREAWLFGYRFVDAKLQRYGQDAVDTEQETKP